MKGVRRIILGGLFLLGGASLFALPYGAGVGAGSLAVLVGLLLILWATFSMRNKRRIPTGPVFTPTVGAGPQPFTCKACGATNMLGAMRCAKCNSPLA